MIKNTFISLFIFLAACEPKDEYLIEQTGIVMNSTSCNGGPEPVYIIKLAENDSIMTATLSKEFQVPNLQIKFKTKRNTTTLFCTQDKTYPLALTVFDIRKVSN